MKCKPKPIPGVLMFVGHDGTRLILEAEVVDSWLKPDFRTIKVKMGSPVGYPTTRWISLVTPWPDCGPGSVRSEGGDEPPSESTGEPNSTRR